MRKIIDGHVHINPRYELPHRDTITRNTKYPYGRLSRKDGPIGQGLPSYFVDNSYPVEVLIESLNEYGVEKAAVMAHMSEDVCEVALDAQTRYPDRIRAAGTFAPKDGCVEKLIEWNEKGLNLLKFEMRGMEEDFPGTTLLDPHMVAMVDEAAKRGMTMTIDPAPAAFACNRPDCMRETIERHPEMKIVICHLGLPYKGIEKDDAVFKKWKDMVMLAKYPNVHLDVTAIPDLFVEENFPYPSAMELLHLVYDEVGPKKFIWGTDIPGTFRTATYYQMVQAFERITFMSDADKDDLFYHNAERVYFAK